MCRFLFLRFLKGVGAQEQLNHLVWPTLTPVQSASVFLFPSALISLTSLPLCHFESNKMVLGVKASASPYFL